jgi:hypothetical protein
MKRPSDELLLNAAALVALLALAGWLVWATEWVDVWRRVPPRGEAARDAHYAIKQIATRLGARVHSPQDLSALPPPGATLVLQSDEWDFLPGRNERLRQWVERDGGHLVLPSFATTGDDIAWVPIRFRRPTAPGRTPSDDEDEDEDEDDDDQDRQTADRRPASAPVVVPARRAQPVDPDFVGPRQGPPPCPLFTESAVGDAPARRLRLCGGEWAARLEAMAPAQPSWSINGPRGAHTLRIALGQGRVTAISEFAFLSNRNVFLGDHAQAAVTALDIRAGAEIWFVMDERRDALLLWLWHRAGPALALAALAIAFGLWRGALRFGPLLPGDTAARRSVAEQIRGTAAFVLRGGGAPLLAAARRALDEAARKRIAGYERMTMGERIAALQRPTAMDTASLTRALDAQMPPRGPGRSRALTDKLALIEQARRRLAFNAPTTP